MKKNNPVDVDQLINDAGRLARQKLYKIENLESYLLAKERRLAFDEISTSLMIYAERFVLQTLLEHSKLSLDLDVYKGVTDLSWKNTSRLLRYMSQHSSGQVSIGRATLNETRRNIDANITAFIENELNQGKGRGK
jgi:hypothetical protein